MNLPQLPYPEEETQELAGRLHNFFKQALAGFKFGGRTAA